MLQRLRRSEGAASHEERREDWSVDGPNPTRMFSFYRAGAARMQSLPMSDMYKLL